MNTNKILIAGVAGAVVAFLLGWLVYGVALNGFFQSNAGSATGVMRNPDEMLWGPMIIGHLTWGILIAIIFGKWANISTLQTGAKAGATIGLLSGATWDMINYGSTNVMNQTGALADIVVMTVITAIVGGVVGMVLGKS